MTKGKPWPVEDEGQLRAWFGGGTKDPGVLAFCFDGKYSANAVYQKLLDLGLISQKEEETPKKTASSSPTAAASAEVELPAELPSVEEALKVLAAAMHALESPNLAKGEVQRLRSLVATAKVYKELLADYMDYRGLEQELMEFRKKFAEPAPKKSQNSAP